MAIKQMDAEARRRAEELHVRLGKIFDSAEQSVDEQMIQEIERTLADVVEEAVRTQREMYPMTGEARLTDDAYLHTRINGVRVKILLDIKQARRRALDIIRKYEHQFDGVTWAPLEQDIEQAMATAVAQAVAERDAEITKLKAVLMLHGHVA